MSDVLQLARPELRSLEAYEPAAYDPALVRLNANESPWRAPGDSTARGLNIYPPPRPVALTGALASHYGVAEDQVLVTRGSSEGIDLMMRAFCRAGVDQVVLCPPTFGMYAVYANIQGARIKNVPLCVESGYGLDVDGIIDAWSSHSRLVFLCSPNNPTGQKLDRGAVTALCESLAGRGVVVIDEAYRDFSNGSDYLSLRERFEHVVLLRTLSKAQALAGLRCGALLADAAVVALLAKIAPPYCFPTPAIELALQALTTDSLAVAEQRLALMKSERERLADGLASLPQVLQVWPSDANFLLVKVADADGLCQRARDGGILVRNFSRQPTTRDCVRITVGQPDQNKQLLAALGSATGD